MKKNIIVAMLGIFSFYGVFAQHTVKGKVVNSVSKKAISDVMVSVLGTSISQKTAANGVFILKNVPEGKQIVTIALKGFETQQFPLDLTGEIDLETIRLYENFQEEDNSSTISLSDDELSDDEGAADNTAGLLQSSKDVFSRAAAFNFPWFRARGYDSEHADVLIDGIKMNKVSNGRPQWSDWGGLNDVLRNQEFANGLAPAEKTFGGVLGSTSIRTRASEQRKGIRISSASTNRNYSGRAMVTYNSGLTKKGWAFSLSSSKRYAKEGYHEGSSYNAWSGFISAEKKLNDEHSINLTAFYTFNRRGKSSPNTQEVYDLKGTKYNAYWGEQDNRNRNSRIKEISEPMAILSHYWNMNDHTMLNTNISFQTGHIGNSRLGYYRALNPDPTYYQKLPSQALAYSTGPNYTEYYDKLTNFQNNGQINWDELYAANVTNGESVYYLYEDRNDDTTITANTNLTTELTSNITLNGRINYSKLESNNYANMIDLLGGSHFTDLDQYSSGNAEQNDLNNPNNKVLVDDKFQYNYIINSTTMDAFTQLQFAYDKIDFFVAGEYANTKHQREGLFRNGSYEDSSFGLGEEQTFNDISFKGGLTYKLTGRYLLNANVGMLSVAPNIRTSFANSRINNSIVPDIKSQKITSFDVSYIYRGPGVKARVTGYTTDFKDATETAFFFAQGIGSQGGDDEDFVAEIVTGVAKRHRGLEFGMELQATPTIKVTGVASVGSFTYTNNPNLYLTSDNVDFPDGFNSLGKTYLKNTKLGGTPEQAYSLGFEYRDPNYWWFGINGNYMADNYLDISPVLRTSNFYKDVDGLPLINPETGNQVSQEDVDNILTQEKFNSVFLLNAVGGKSWKIGDKYIGFFANISNILGREYKTGGFEQARNSNFVRLQQEKNLETRRFGPKYWYGNKTTYYLNLYLRF